MQLLFSVFSHTIIIFCLCLSNLIYAQNPSIVINEIMASNGTTFSDEDGDYEDWIELYNSGDKMVNLDGWGISDDYDNPFRWVLPAVTIEPDEYLLIWASNKDRSDVDGELHTNFAISSSGEEVLLTNPNGDRIDVVSPRPIPRDLSWGRFPDGSDNWFYFKKATPGTTNIDPSYSGLIEPISFSHDPGFYSESFLLDLYHSDPNVVIYYTLDGSNPTPESELYSGPIEIYDRSIEDNVYSMIPTNTWPGSHSRGWNPPAGLVKKGTTIRAVAVKNGFIPYEINGSFFVFPEKEETYPLPVFSIITDPANLFDDSIGIYVPGINHTGDAGTGNFRERGIEWERPAHLSFFEDGEEVISQEVGLRIHGGYTRRFPQKSLRVYARSTYGENTLDYDFFGDGDFESYKRLLLRQSGNDWNFSMFRDGTIQDIWEHVGMEGQRFRPAVAFINGEFWGLHHIRERQDKHYLNRKFGLKEDEIDILTRNRVVKEGDSLHYQAMIDFISANDMTSDAVLDQLGTMMDLGNFMAYYTLQCYCGNTDWPHNNIDYWRKRTDYTPDAPYGHDGRWRWLVYDLDRCLGYSNVNTNMINWITSPTGNNRGAWATFVIRSLLENQRFRYEFINRMADHLNSTLNEERVLDYIETNRSSIVNVIEEHIERWRRPQSITSWNSQVNSMRNFAQQRPVRMRNHIRSYFQISSNINITLDVNESDYGSININSLLVNADLPAVDPVSPYPWTGIYFHDIPVKLAAASNSGYQFDFWTIGGDTLYEQDLTLAFQNDIHIKAYFSVDSSFDFFPEPYHVDNCAYVFNFWDENSPAGSYPMNMVFVYMNEDDPGLDAEIEGFTEGVYDLESRTRINGLSHDGFSFINTGNTDGNPGFPGRRLGGALLGISTLDTDELFVKWEGGTVIPNSRAYAIRLQYRLGDEGEFMDLLDREGNPIEYVRSEETGHFEIIGPFALPQDAMERPYVQLFWRYYHTGERLDDESGARDQLRIGQIILGKDSMAMEEYSSEQLSLKVDYTISNFCNGQSNTGISINEIYGAEPVVWVFEGQVDTLYEGLELLYSPGSYNYEIIDALGCSRLGTFDILSSDSIAIHWEYEPPVCFGDSNGSIRATIVGGTPPLTYEWSTGQLSDEPGRFILWDFNGLVPSDSPPPTEGDGEAVLIGGVNNPESGTNGSGSSDPATDNQAWQTTSYPSQGNSPRTAGVQFNISTEGYQNIEFQFDQRLSNTAANTWVLLYTADRTANTVSWNEAEVYRIEPQLSGTGDTWHNNRGSDFSDIPELNDNPHVAFRIVSDFDPQTGQYESARLDRSYSGGGTSRWDMIEVSGDPLNRITGISDLMAGTYSLSVVDALGCNFTDSIVLPDPLQVEIPFISGPQEVESSETQVYIIESGAGLDVLFFIEVEGGRIDSIIDEKEIHISWDEVESGQQLQGFIRAEQFDFFGCSEEFVLPVLISGPTSVVDIKEGVHALVYPNPNKGHFTVQVNYPGFKSDWSLELYSTLGQLVKRYYAEGNSFQISIEYGNSGPFLLLLRDSNGLLRWKDVVLVYE